ncbi:MAG: hypothetical protein COB38_04710 [Gammaproteobacteria bacterium]|nr:MAG: hypothetical protein COB38_04710 [Gammaproteobacteria bacterium]
MKLFWVSTDDHHEDWFMFAETDAKAAQLHEEYEGYNPEDASALLVCYVPDDINVIEGWPETEDLLNLGAVFLRTETPRKIEIGNSVYTEGGLDALIEMSLNIKH